MSNKLIERFENIVGEVNELMEEAKVIVHQLRVPSTIQAVEDIIEFEGQQYKKVEREARVGDVITYSEIGGGWMNISPNKPYKVYEEDGLFGLLFTRDNGGPCRVYGDDSKNGRSSGNVKVYELIVEGKKKIKGLMIEIDAPKSANQQRAEVIEKAKEFVKLQFVTHWNGSDDLVISINGLLHNCDFVTNEEKRTVVALLSIYSTPKKKNLKGIAKCMPTDVFNEHIGKAIALGRALGLDVNEFENAVQPTFEIGQYIQFNKYSSKLEEVQLINVEGEKLWFVDGEDGREVYVTSNRDLLYPSAYQPIITNDTNAIYGGVE